MSNLGAAIDVAAEYAYHLCYDDKVPKAQAIQVGAAAVVRAARANPGKFVANQESGGTGIGWSGPALAAVGSSLSMIGWIKTLMTGG